MNGPISAWRDWREKHEILRDARRQSADASEVLRFKVKDQLTFASLALDRGDQHRATEIWNKLMTDYPTDTHRCPLALGVLLGLRRFDEAAAIMANGQRRAPGDPRFLQGLAEIAQARGDHEEAIRLFASMRKRFPGLIGGYTLAASSLRTIDRFAEAEALAKKAIDQFPEAIGGYLEYARVGAQRQNWDEALNRWEPVRNRFGYFGGYVGSAEALTHLGRYAEAEDLLQQARLRFGMNPGPLSEYARVAEAKGDLDEATKRWKVVLERFPIDMAVYLTVSQAFARIGQPTEAEATLRTATERFPVELRPALELAKLLHYKRRDHQAAAEAWTTVRQNFPDTEEAYTQGAEALRQAGRPAQADALTAEHRRRFKPQ